MSQLVFCRLVRCIALLLVLAAASVARATTTTWSTAYTASNVPSSDTIVLVDGGSLQPGNQSFGILTNSGTVVFAYTTTATNQAQLSGTGGYVVRLTSGTLTQTNQANNAIGPWIFEGGVYSFNNVGSPSNQVFGLGSLTFAGGTIRTTWADFSFDQPNYIVTPSGGVIDFSGASGLISFTGRDVGSGRLGITGTGSITLRAPGTPTAGNTASSLQFGSGPNIYSGTTVLDGGVFSPATSSLQAGGSPFGSSIVTLQAATLSAQWNPQTGSFRTATLPNDLVIGAGNATTHSVYTNASNYNVMRLSGNVSGTGGLTVFAGYATLAGSNSFTGDTRLGAISTNLLSLQNVNALAGSTLDMNAADAGNLALAGSGTFYKLGGLKGSRSLVQPSGTTTNVALEIGTNDQSTSFSGNLGQLGSSGYDGIIKSGTGALTFTGTYFTSNTPVVSTPGVQITGGVLAVNSDRALGASLADGSANTVVTTINGGTLRQTTAFTVARPVTVGTGGATLDTSPVGASATPAVSGTVSGTGSVSIIANGDIDGTATGATNLSGANTYVGTTTITSGMVRAESSFGDAANQVVLNGGGLLGTGGARTNSFATQIGQSNGTLRAAAASDVLNQGGVVSGSGTLRSSGNGTVNLQAANTHTGDARVISGTMNLANTNALQSSTLDMNAADAGTVGFTAGTGVYNVAGLKGSRGIAFSSGTLSVGANNASTTYSGPLSGSGNFTKVGSGALTLSGTNNYSGGTTLSAGSLIGTTASLQGAITNNAAVEFAQGTAGTYAGNMTGSGAVTKSGIGTVTLSGTNNYSGGTTVSAGRLVGTTSSIQGAIVNDAEVEFAQATSGTYSGAMTGNGGLIKSGNGAVTMTGASSYGSTTDVQAGTLVVNANNVGVTAPITIASGATLAGSGTHGGAIVVNDGATLSPGNSPGTFTAASGTWAGGGNYNWQLYDAAGTAGSTWDLLDLSGGLDITATSSSPFKVNLWTLSGTGPDVNGSALNFNPNGNYSWRIATAAGGVTGFAANKFQVNTAATNGAGGFANSVGSGQFSVGNTGNDVNVVFTPAIVLDVTSGTQTQTQQGTAANIESAVSVTKTGAGTVIMDGNNTYSAATTISQGTMLVTGTLANSAVTVASSATLGGDGRVGQTVTVSGSGSIAPGAAPTGIGTLELGGLSLSPTATTLLGVSGTSPGVTYDQVSILGGGPLTYGGTLDLSTSNIDGAPNGTSYKLFDFAGTPSGNFNALTPLGGEYAGITWSGPVGGVWTSSNGTGGNYLTFTQGTGTLAVVPEPTTLALAALGGLGCWMARRRKRA